jgi:hypothetical protein
MRNENIYIVISFFSIISKSMLAQIYTTRNKFENIPKDILDNIDKMRMDECIFLTDLEGRYFNALYQIEEGKFNLFSKKICFLTGNNVARIHGIKVLIPERI